MDPDLVHSSSSWLAEDNARSAVETESMKFSVAIFSRGGNLADTDFVRDHLDWLFANDRISERNKRIHENLKIDALCWINKKPKGPQRNREICS